MSRFPISYDAEAGILQLDGRGGASVMLNVLLKAKFGEGFDPDVLFSVELADLMTKLGHNSIIPQRAEAAPFSRSNIQTLAEGIVSDSLNLGWWDKSRVEQVEFVQAVVVAPHRLSERQLEDLFEDIESNLFWKRKIVNAAGQPDPT